LILGLDRLLARVRGRVGDERQRPPGDPRSDDEVGLRLDAARTRLRAEIAPLEDENEDERPD
jgi:hypothetical protein